MLTLMLSESTTPLLSHKRWKKEKEKKKGRKGGKHTRTEKKRVLSKRLNGKEEEKKMRTRKEKNSTPHSRAPRTQK